MKNYSVRERVGEELSRKREGGSEKYPCAVAVLLGNTTINCVHLGRYQLHVLCLSMMKLPFLEKHWHIATVLLPSGEKSTLHLANNYDHDGKILVI